MKPKANPNRMKTKFLLCTWQSASLVFADARCRGRANHNHDERFKSDTNLGGIMYVDRNVVQKSLKSYNHFQWGGARLTRRYKIQANKFTNLRTINRNGECQRGVVVVFPVPREKVDGKCKKNPLKKIRLQPGFPTKSTIAIRTYGI